MSATPGGEDFSYRLQCSNYLKVKSGKSVKYVGGFGTGIGTLTPLCRLPGLVQKEVENAGAGGPREEIHMVRIKQVVRVPTGTKKRTISTCTLSVKILKSCPKLNH